MSYRQLNPVQALAGLGFDLSFSASTNGSGTFKASACPKGQHVEGGKCVPGEELDPVTSGSYNPGPQNSPCVNLGGVYRYKAGPVPGGYEYVCNNGEYFKNTSTITLPTRAPSACSSSQPLSCCEYSQTKATADGNTIIFCSNGAIVIANASGIVDQLSSKQAAALANMNWGSLTTPQAVQTLKLQGATPVTLASGLFSMFSSPASKPNTANPYLGGQSPQKSNVGQTNIGQKASSSSTSLSKLGKAVSAAFGPAASAVVPVETVVEPGAPPVVIPVETDEPDYLKIGLIGLAVVVVAGGGYYLYKKSN